MKYLLITILIYLTFCSIQSDAQESFSKVLFPEFADNLQANSLIKTTDNQLVSIGYWRDWHASFENGHIVKFNENGNIIWSKILVSPFDYTFFTDIISTPDSGCIVLGDSEKDVVLIKIDLNGDVVWGKKSDWEISNLHTKVICPTTRNGFAIAGNFTETPVDSPIFSFVSVFEESGNASWIKILQMNEINSMVQLPDSTLLITVMTIFQIC